MSQMPKSPGELPQSQSQRIQKRGFVEVPLHGVGHQAGRDRFPVQHLSADAKLPYLNPWRNNLTALSQVHNLYFVAYEDELYVYEPEFPIQHLPLKESIRLSLPRSSPWLRGYFPDSNSHSVNNLLVADLGKKEAVVCACDDGDVLAFWTDSVREMIEEVGKRQSRSGEDLGAALLDDYWNKNDRDTTLQASGSTQHSQRVGRNPQVIGHEFEQPFLEGSQAEHSDQLPVLVIVNTFLHVNVGQSAWGLAVHTDLQLIAVSSNTHRVCVYAFALDPTIPFSIHSPAENMDHDEDTELWETLPRGEGSLLFDRERNQRRVLIRHITNIPSIAFDNSTANRGFLVSTDISGRIITWDVDTGRVIHDICSNDEQLVEPHQFHAGWGVMCIDRRAFTKAPDLITASGLCSVMWDNDRYLIVDISASRLNVRNAGVWNIEGLLVTGRDRAGPGTLPALNSNNTRSADADCTLALEYPDAITSMLLATHCTELSQLYRYNKRGAVPRMSVEHMTIEELETFERSFMFTSTLTEVIPLTQSSLPTNTPLMLLQPQSVHLFQTLNILSRDSRRPVVFLKDPLHQPTIEGLDRLLSNNDRLNLYCQIPELGVVLVGSPKGRVAVLTLWHLDNNPFHQKKTSSTETASGGVHSEPVCTFRLDHLLPTKQQEVLSLRPLMQLVGLTASPVQGCGGGSREERWSCRRWRVMMMYRDHTVFSYELSRYVDPAFDGVTVS